MKPYKIPVIVGLLFSVVFYSCDDLLDPKAETNLTEEFANVSYNNTLARSIGLYSYLPDGLSYLDGAMMAAASDEAEYTLETASIHGFNVGAGMPIIIQTDRRGNVTLKEYLLRIYF